MVLVAFIPTALLLFLPAAPIRKVYLGGSAFACLSRSRAQPAGLIPPPPPDNFHATHRCSGNNKPILPWPSDRIREQFIRSNSVDTPNYTRIIPSIYIVINTPIHARIIRLPGIDFDNQPVYLILTTEESANAHTRSQKG
jgi:hypothetical protein